MTILIVKPATSLQDESKIMVMPSEEDSLGNIINDQHELAQLTTRLQKKNIYYNAIFFFECYTCFLLYKIRDSKNTGIDHTSQSASLSLDMWAIELQNEKVFFDIDNYEVRFKENLKNLKHLINPEVIHKYITEDQKINPA